MSLLEVNNLKTYFETSKGCVRAVDGISFSIEKGQAVGLVGESGCGKTTTALSIIDLLPENGRIAGGSIILDGKDLTKLSKGKLRKQRWKNVSIIFQGAMNALNPVMRVSDQIIEAIIYHDHLTYDQARKKTKDLFNLVEINEERIDNYPHEFSGGMKQRVMIAMALACDPKLIMGDEPTTALDVMVQAQILNLLNKIKKETDTGLLIITHDLSILGEICDEIVIMYAGKIFEKGSTEQIYNKHAHPYTYKLFKSFPDIQGERILEDPLKGSAPNLLEILPGCKFHPRCSYARDKCRVEEPELKEVAINHYCACHYGGAWNE